MLTELTCCSLSPAQSVVKGVIYCNRRTPTTGGWLQWDGRCRCHHLSWLWILGPKPPIVDSLRQPHGRHSPLLQINRWTLCEYLVLVQTVPRGGPDWVDLTTFRRHCFPDWLVFLSFFFHGVHDPVGHSTPTLLIFTGQYDLAGHSVLANWSLFSPRTTVTGFQYLQC